MDTSEMIKAVEEANAAAQKKTVKNKKKKGKPGRKKKPLSLKAIGCMVAVVIVIVLLIVVAALYLWNASFVEINLPEQTNLRVSGFDGKGSGEVAVEAVAGYIDFFDTVETKISKDELLSNGDQLVVSYSYDEELAKELKLHVMADDTVVTVEGLPAGRVITLEDLFEPVQLTVEDISPVIKVTVDIAKREGFYQDVEYTVLNPKDYYCSGDKLIVEASFDEEMAVQNAYDVEKGDNGYRKEYPISSEDEYVTDVADISADMLQRMIANGATYFDAARAKEYGLRIFSEAHLKPMWENKNTFFSWVNPYVISAYFNTVTEEGKSLIETHVNDVKVVYEATLTQPDGVSCKAEIVVQYTDLVKHADGTIDPKLETGKIIAASYRNSNIKRLVNDTDDGNYLSTKLELN